MAALRAVSWTLESGANVRHEGGILHPRARQRLSPACLHKAESAAIAGRPLSVAAPAHIKRSSWLRLISLNSSAGAGSIANWPEDSGVPGSSSPHDSTASSVNERHLEERATGNVSFVQVWCTHFTLPYDRHAKLYVDRWKCIIYATASYIDTANVCLSRAGHCQSDEHPSGKIFLAMLASLKGSAL